MFFVVLLVSLSLLPHTHDQEGVLLSHFVSHFSVSKERRVASSES